MLYGDVQQSHLVASCDSLDIKPTWLPLGIWEFPDNSQPHHEPISSTKPHCGFHTSHLRNGNFHNFSRTFNFAAVKWKLSQLQQFPHPPIHIITFQNASDRPSSLFLPYLDYMFDNH